MRVGDVEDFQDALDAAVLAVATVESDECAVEVLLRKLGHSANTGVERMRVHALSYEGVEHHGTAFQGNLALRRASAEQDCQRHGGQQCREAGRTQRVVFL